MGITIVRERFTLPTATTDPIEFTTTKLGGLTPKAAILIVPVSGCSTDGTATAGMVKGIGFTDGYLAPDSFHALTSADAGASSATGTRNLTGRVLEEVTPATTVQQVVYTKNPAFITNGVSLSSSEVGTSAATFVEIIFFAGSDLSAALTSTTLTNAVDTAHDITDPGFEPDVVISCCTSSSGIGLGLVHNDRAGTVTQRAMIHRARSARPTAENCAAIRASYGGGVSAGAFTSDANCWLEFGTFDSSGFTMTTRVAAPGSSMKVSTLALRFGTGPLVSSKVYTFDTPTATGDNTDTNPGFQPQFVMYLGSLLETMDSFNDTTLAGSSSISTIDTTDAHCASWSDEDAADPTNTQSLMDDQAVNLPLHDGSAGLAASFSAFTSTGVTLNWSDIETNAKKWLGLAIGAEVAATYAPPPFRRPNTLRRM